VERIGRYRAERVLGSGAFGTVWLAHDESLDADVAIKVLAENWARDDAFRRRFLDEARILFRADSDHLIRVHTVDELEDGRPYFVMDYADRGSLEERMRDKIEAGGWYRVEEAVALSRDIADGLRVVHALDRLPREQPPDPRRGRPRQRDDAHERDRPDPRDDAPLDRRAGRRLTADECPERPLGGERYSPHSAGWLLG
jgi:hypothetical protein